MGNKFEFKGDSSYLGHMESGMFHPQSNEPALGETPGTLRCAMANAILFARNQNKAIKCELNGAVVQVKPDDTVELVAQKQRDAVGSPGYLAAQERRTQMFNSRIDQELSDLREELESLDFADEGAIMDWMMDYLATVEVSGKRDIGGKEIRGLFGKNGYESDGVLEENVIPAAKPRAIIGQFLAFLDQGKKPSRVLTVAIAQWKRESKGSSRFASGLN